MADFLANRNSTGDARDYVGHCACFSGILESDRTACGISQIGTVKTVVIIYLDDHEGECRCCVCGSTGCAVTTVACVPVWAQISGTGNCGNGWW